MFYCIAAGIDDPSLFSNGLRYIVFRRGWAEDAGAAFAQACAFFDVDLDDEAQAATVKGPVFRQHAKQPNVAFDGAAYKRQQKEADPSAAEVAVALDWGGKLAQQSETPIHLGDTLLTRGRA